MKELKTLDKIESAISTELDKLSFNPELLSCDHLCYIAKSEESYNKWVSRIPELGTIIREINGASMNLKGKNFLVIRLNNPILFMHMQVDILEIKQSNNQDFQEDWQHAEFIPNCSLTDILDQNTETSFESGRLNDQNNQEIGIRFSKQYSLKFRTTTLADI